MNAIRRTSVRLPEKDPVFLGAGRVVEVLRDAGHEAWIVGGAVRDLVMGLSPFEYDIATSGRPDEVMALFRRTVPVGVRFGVVRVLLGDREYEVATFRSDRGYSDGRRPDEVTFTDLAGDVGRRDFTMNGLTLDPVSGEVTDLVGGLDDIEEGLIRAIGDADSRFEEDRLRPLRAIRFAAQTGFEIERKTLAAIREGAAGTGTVSSERVRDEISKMLATQRPGTGLMLAGSVGVLPVILPELSGPDVPVKPVSDVLDLLAKSPLEVMWAALFLRLGPDAARSAAHRLHHSRRMTETVVGILEAAESVTKLQDYDEAVEKRVLRADVVPGALSVLGAWLDVTGGDQTCVTHARERLMHWKKSELFPVRLITGDDVLAAGILAGSGVGEALAAVEDEQLRGRIRTRDEALEFLKKLNP